MIAALRNALERLLATSTRRRVDALGARLGLGDAPPAPALGRAPVEYDVAAALSPDEHAAVEALADALHVRPSADMVAAALDGADVLAELADAIREARERMLAPLVRAALRGGLPPAVFDRARATARLATMEGLARRVLASRRVLERRAALRQLGGLVRAATEGPC